MGKCKRTLSYKVWVEIYSLIFFNWMSLINRSTWTTYLDDVIICGVVGVEQLEFYIYYRTYNSTVLFWHHFQITFNFANEVWLRERERKKKLDKFPTGKTIDYFPDKISTREQLESITYGLGTRFLDPSLHSK